ncbi:MAG: gamma-glutamyl-gamma-aminobutyrate hydrolase family protein [Methylophilaceae bacterium]|nr:gamma-glutamyl-gamma-aminobutyrate hydrolase family protein [Methylophilaceae bacterium]
MNKRRPIIGIPACIKMIGDHPFHAAGAKYISAVVSAANCIPLVLPAIGDEQDLDTILELVDGLLLTGSASNIEPSRYNTPLFNADMLMDTARDATTFPLIEAAIAAGIPILGICRGFQEMNVAFGGTLHQEVHTRHHLMDHREKSGTLDVQYGPSHPVQITEGSFLQHLLNGADEIMVNSIHGQGIDHLGYNLSAEALAPDGLVEAIRVTNAKTFALAVQWHPEWKVTENSQSLAIFTAFGDACKAHFASRSLVLTKVLESQRFKVKDSS